MPILRKHQSEEVDDGGQGSDLPLLTAEKAAAVTFQISEPRGYYHIQVDAFVSQVVAALQAWEAQVFQLTQQLHEAQTEVDQVRYDNQSLKAQIEIFRVNGAPMVDESGNYLRESQVQVAAPSKEHQEELRRLAEANTELQERILELQQEIADLHQRYAHLTPSYTDFAAMPAAVPTVAEPVPEAVETEYEASYEDDFGWNDDQYADPVEPVSAPVPASPVVPAAPPSPMNRTRPVPPAPPRASQAAPQPAPAPASRAFPRPAPAPQPVQQPVAPAAPVQPAGAAAPTRPAAPVAPVQQPFAQQVPEQAAPATPSPFAQAPAGPAPVFAAAQTDDVWNAGTSAGDDDDQPSWLDVTRIHGRD